MNDETERPRGASNSSFSLHPSSVVPAMVTRVGPPGSRLALWQPGRFEWTKVVAPVRGLAGELEGFRFIHLSDLHLRGGWAAAYDRLADQLAAARADLLLVTGDFLDDKYDFAPGTKMLRRLIPRLSARLGVYGILGNHDSDLVGPRLAELGVTMLDGRRAVLTSAAGAQLELIGLPGVSRRDLDANFVANLPAKQPRTLRIVLSHYPDQFPRARPLAADFFLAGHTHGGQVCLPGGRAIITHDRMPKALCKGIFRIGQTWYAVSRGFGFAGLRLRVNCPAQVIEVEVRRMKDDDETG
jgi:uncharacterized protein